MLWNKNLDSLINYYQHFLSSGYRGDRHQRQGSSGCSKRSHRERKRKREFLSVNKWKRIDYKFLEFYLKKNVFFYFSCYRKLSTIRTTKTWSTNKKRLLRSKKNENENNIEERKKERKEKKRRRLNTEFVFWKEEMSFCFSS